MDVFPTARRTVEGDRGRGIRVLEELGANEDAGKVSCPTCSSRVFPEQLGQSSRAAFGT